MGSFGQQMFLVTASCDDDCSRSFETSGRFHMLSNLIQALSPKIQLADLRLLGLPVTRFNLLEPAGAAAGPSIHNAGRLDGRRRVASQLMILISSVRAKNEQAVRVRTMGAE